MKVTVYFNDMNVTPEGSSMAYTFEGCMLGVATDATNIGIEWGEEYWIYPLEVIRAIKVVRD